MANYSSGRSNGEVEFRILEKIGVIESYKSGWSKEANIVAWNGGQGKLDIRDWDPQHERMSRGITLHENEAEALTRILMQRFPVSGARGGVPGRKSSGSDFQEPDSGSRDAGGNTRASGDSFEPEEQAFGGTGAEEGDEPADTVYN